jgi:predicted alpha/beta-hydrolase family hydrolase
MKSLILIDFPSCTGLTVVMNNETQNKQDMFRNIGFQASKSFGKVSAILQRPSDARVLLVFAHGAGAGMRSGFMESMSRDLAEAQIATFRYQFPYMEEGKKSPDPQPILTATVQSAVAAAHEAAPDLPLVAGGKSLGGRMTSMAYLPPLVKGLVFFGFPLHAPGKPSTKRAEHLSNLSLPMLFLQGTRDTFTDLELLRPICARLGERAYMHIIEGADHSFHMLKSSALNDEQVRKQLAQTAADWMARLLLS